MYFPCFLLYQYTDPWTLRRASVSSLVRNGKEPRTPSTNFTDTLRVSRKPSFSYHDSGIVPDGSIGYHQGGVINAANETDFNQAGEIHDSPRVETRIKLRPGLKRKRISFKDQQEATEVWPLREGQQAAPAMGCPPSETTSEAHNSIGSNSVSSILISWNANQPSKATSSTDMEVKSSSSDGRQKNNEPGRVKE